MNTEKLNAELQFKAIRSSGAGGQHVNKVSSKIELSFDLEKSQALTEEQKELLLKNLSNRLTKDAVLILFCDETRSQHRNKELAVERFLALISKNIVPKKPRKATKPSKASIKKRAENKQRQSLKKSLRKKPDVD